MGALQGQFPVPRCEKPRCSDQGRDYVTGEMWKSKPPFRPRGAEKVKKSKQTGDSKARTRLCLNKAASEEIIWHCKWGS